MTTPRLCSVKDCTRRHMGHGYCQTHLNRLRSAGELPPPAPAPSRPATCQHPDGCERLPNGGNGLCQMHYHRMRTHGEPGPAEPLAARPLAQQAIECPVDDGEGPCGKPALGKGLCSTHLRRLQRNGTTELRRSPNGSRGR